jgi:hypothetical protein
MRERRSTGHRQRRYFTGCRFWASSSRRSSPCSIIRSPSIPGASPAPPLTSRGATTRSFYSSGRDSAKLGSVQGWHDPAEWVRARTRLVWAERSGVGGKGLGGGSRRSWPIGGSIPVLGAEPVLNQNHGLPSRVFLGFVGGGSAWESNPPTVRQPHGATVLKTAEATRPRALPPTSLAGPCLAPTHQRPNLRPPRKPAHSGGPLPTTNSRRAVSWLTPRCPRRWAGTPAEAGAQGELGTGPESRDRAYIPPPLTDPTAFWYLTPPRWGCSSVGRALEWHSRGRRFNSVQLHSRFS